jgi:hypothetical protein
MLDREMLEAYQSRWLAVNDVETLERRQASLALRWQQLNALLVMAAALGLVMPQDEAPEDSTVIHRWNRLVVLHLTGSQDSLP